MSNNNLPRRNATTSEELADPSGVSRARVLERLGDWRERVHKLYEDIERALKAKGFGFSRDEKYASSEELPRRVGITEAEQPKIDVLRITGPDGQPAAVLSPHGLWIIGANGRVDLRIIRLGGSETYLLLDQSEPLTGASQWIRMPIGSPFERQPFDPGWLRSKLQ